MSHSIPESAALVIDTPAGRIVHSGDFKLDENPLVGEPWDAAAFAAIAAETPVKALMCDSTNVFSTASGPVGIDPWRPIARTDAQGRAAWWSQPPSPRTSRG
jgi:hypothetical protein